MDILICITLFVTTCIAAQSVFAMIVRRPGTRLDFVVKLRTFSSIADEIGRIPGMHLFISLYGAQVYRIQHFSRNRSSGI